MQETKIKAQKSNCRGKVLVLLEEPDYQFTSNPILRFLFGTGFCKPRMFYTAFRHIILWIAFCESSISLHHDIDLCEFIFLRKKGTRVSSFMRGFKFSSSSCLKLISDSIFICQKRECLLLLNFTSFTTKHYKL